MRLGCLVAPDGQEVCARIESLEPDFKAEGEAENVADDDEVSVDLEECSVGGYGDGGDAEEEGYEDEDSVDDCG